MQVGPAISRQPARNLRGHWSARTTTLAAVDYVEPPADPDEWTDEQWLEWLRATDEAAIDESEHVVAVVTRIVQSAPGQVLGQAMLGMAKAIYGRETEQVTIVAEGLGEGFDDEPFFVRLDLDHPELSSVVFKAEPNSPG